MSESDQLISELREQAKLGKVITAYTGYVVALFRRAAQTISDQQDMIDNLTRGLSRERAEVAKSVALLSSLRADVDKLRKLLEKDVHE